MSFKIELIRDGEGLNLATAYPNKELEQILIDDGFEIDEGNCYYKLFGEDEEFPIEDVVPTVKKLLQKGAKFKYQRGGIAPTVSDMIDQTTLDEMENFTLNSQQVI